MPPISLAESRRVIGKRLDPGETLESINVRKRPYGYAINANTADANYYGLCHPYSEYDIELDTCFESFPEVLRAVVNFEIVNKLEIERGYRCIFTRREFRPVQTALFACTGVESTDAGSADIVTGRDTIIDRDKIGEDIRPDIAEIDDVGVRDTDDMEIDLTPDISSDEIADDIKDHDTSRDITFDIDSADGCIPTASTDKSCNGIDDDCDGETDEDYVNQEISCGIGLCERSGEIFCLAGREVEDCTPAMPLNQEDCNNDIDDNCNGAVNDGCVCDYDDPPRPCGEDEGECEPGTQECMDGFWWPCEGAVGPADEICDNLDNDCDGRTDENFHIGERCTEGEGACEAEGEFVCSEDQQSSECTAVPGNPSEEVCDNIDNNCDGETDEGILPEDTTCGIGACFSEGVSECINGVLVDSCVAGSPLGDDANCDGVDDNCNGRADENFRSSEIFCGLGECRQSGMTACIDGTVVEDCEPEEPFVEICNDGLDNNCNGEADEWCVDNIRTGSLVLLGYGEEGLMNRPQLLTALQGSNPFDVRVLFYGTQEPLPPEGITMCDFTEEAGSDPSLGITPCLSNQLVSGLGDGMMTLRGSNPGEGFYEWFLRDDNGFDIAAFTFTYYSDATYFGGLTIPYPLSALSSEPECHYVFNNFGCEN